MGSPRPRRRRARGEGSIYRYATQAGNLRWRAELPGGKSGKAGFRTQGEALAWLREHHGKPAAPGTVGEWLTRWLELRRADFAPSTCRSDRDRCRRWLVPLLGAVKLRDLTGYHVRAMLARMHQVGQSDHERHMAGRTLRKALNEAVALGVLGQNPMTSAGGRVKLPGFQRPEKVVFDEEAIKKLLGAADRQQKGHVVRLWLDAGLRPEEMFGLSWEDLDLSAGTVTVRKALDALTGELRPPKTAKSRRVIDLSSATVASLSAYAHQNTDQNMREIMRGPFHPTKTGLRWDESNHRKLWWLPLLRAAGLEGRGFSPYSCRHTMATLLLRAGRPVKEVSERLGHASAAMTLTVYAHTIPGDQRRSAEVMGRLLG